MLGLQRSWAGAGLLACAVLSASLGCESTIDDSVPAKPGTGGSAGTGSAGTGAVGAGECKPPEGVCYVEGPEGPGNECLAQRNNVGKSRVQFRSTWVRTIAPAGNASDGIYGILRTRSQIKMNECHMGNGVGGFILLTDWDRSSSVITEQTVRNGYASYSGAPAEGAPAATDLIRDGLCFAEYDGAADAQGALALPAGRGMSAPWHVAPITAKRVADDFNVMSRRGTVPEGEGIAFIDEAKGIIHGFSPLTFVTVLDSRSAGLAIPIREVEIRAQLNDSTFNCAGRFRANAMTLAANCDSSDQKNPPWGCADDGACPPAGFGPETGPGTGPIFIEGYFLITELEQVYSSLLGATLCVTYPGQQKSIDDGWAVQTDGRWNCRNSPKWNPALPDDAGLPRGDWCSKTNGPASDSCHDAYRSLTYSAGQAFNIKEGTCPLAPP